MPQTLQTFLLAARARRRLSQQELANIAQCHVMSVSKVERGEHANWSPRIAAAIGLALHEVLELSGDEMSDFLRLTGVPGSIFLASQPITDEERDRRVLAPVVDRLRKRYGVERLLALLSSIDALTRAEQPAEEEPEAIPTLRHITPPRYRPELGGTEQIITDFGPLTKKPAKPNRKKA
jgi:transcriptional regulator with XRE-family HTH domain